MAGSTSIDGHVDAVIGERVADDPAEEVVADDPSVRDPQPEPRGATGHDRGRATDREPDRPDELLDLAELGHRVVVDDEDVGVDVPDDEQVDLALGLGAAIARALQRWPQAPGEPRCYHLGEDARPYIVLDPSSLRATFAEVSMTPVVSHVRHRRRHESEVGGL